jgi:hypothetical protein
MILMNDEKANHCKTFSNLYLISQALGCTQCWSRHGPNIPSNTWVPGKPALIPTDHSLTYSPKPCNSESAH